MERVWPSGVSILHGRQEAAWQGGLEELVAGDPRRARERGVEVASSLDVLGGQHIADAPIAALAQADNRTILHLHLDKSGSAFVNGVRAAWAPG